PTLSPVEVAIRRRRRAFACFQRIGIHAKAHRASGLAPFEPGVPEDTIEPFLFGSRLDALRAWDDKRVHTSADVMPSNGAPGGPQILDPRIGTGADEDAVDGDLVDRRAR